MLPVCVCVFFLQSNHFARQNLRRTEIMQWTKLVRNLSTDIFCRVQNLPTSSVELYLANHIAVFETDSVNRFYLFVRP